MIPPLNNYSLKMELEQTKNIVKKRDNDRRRHRTRLRKHPSKSFKRKS
jgi:hypothetical protein